MGSSSSLPTLALAALSASVILAGCGSSGNSSTTPTTTTASATTTTTETPASSAWAWRTDEDFGVQITYDLSGNMTHSIYGGCWRDFPTDTLGKEAVQGGKTFVDLSGETGLTLFNKQLTEGKRGCLMRKSRMPIDLSKIGRMEMDIRASGPGDKAPWYSVWLAPMMYSVADASEKAAEIDLIENYQQAGRGSDVDGVKSNFAQCDPTIPGMKWTAPFCKALPWGLHATAVNHHMTLTATEEGAEGRVIKVRHCPATSQSCTTGDYASIKVTKPNPDVPDWFPIWNKTAARERYGHYWLVADIWWTSETAFQLNVTGVRFFLDNGTEWKIPLSGAVPPASFPLEEGFGAGSIAGPETAVVVL